MALVSTTLGDIEENELDIELKREDNQDTWVMQRICTYKGTLFPDAVGTVVRQDAWITVKNGQGASATANS